MARLLWHFARVRAWICGGLTGSRFEAATISPAPVVAIESHTRTRASPSCAARRVAAVRERTLALYDAVTVLMLLGIAILIAYSIRLGSLASPGAQESFGLAIALMALMGAP